MPHLDNLLKYVRTGTAEGDRAFLGDIFITPVQFNELCGIEAGGLRLLVGNKGVGKSAIVEHMKKVFSSKNVPALLIRPDNIAQHDLPTSEDIGALKRHYYEILLKTIGSQIGSQLKGLLTGSAAKLHNEARAKGLTEDDFIQKSLTLISGLAIPVTKINGSQLAKDLSGMSSPNTLTKAINSQLLASGSLFFLLIDDTDQLAAPDKPAHLNRIWALLLAVRRLCGECPALRAVITLRSGVWTRLTTESQGQRDQTDHMRGLVIPLNADDKLMSDIIRKRLQRAADDADKKRVDPYSVFFFGDQMSLPSSKETRPWETFIIKSARERPRDAIQLIKNMIACAVTKRLDIIGSDEAAEAMKVYSSERVDDIANEFSVDCPTIREIINTFMDVDFEVGFEALRQHLVTIPSSFSITMRGVLLHPGVDDDGIAILSLLHETGFINPRIPDNTMSRGFRHILFQDDPTFARVANWNGMQGTNWEIHPAFRTYLMGAKKATLARQMGLKDGR